MEKPNTSESWHNTQEVIDIELPVGGKSYEELKLEFDDAHIYVSKFAEQSIKQGEIEFSKDIEHCHFSLGTLRELLQIDDFEDIRKILDPEYLQSKGYKLCKSADGFYVRLAYKSQPESEVIQMGMKPIKDNSGNERILNVGHYSGEGDNSSRLEVATTDLYLDKFGMKDTHLRPNPNSLWMFRKK